MQELAQNGYTDAEVLDALRGRLGYREFGFRYELLDSDNLKVGDLDNVLGGEVAYNSFADIKRTATFKVLDDGTINYLSDRIKPWVRLHMPRDETLAGSNIRNGTFEEDLVGWIDQVGATQLTRVNTQAATGTWSMEVKAFDTSTTILQCVTNEDGSGLVHLLEAGQPITIRAKIRIPAAMLAKVTDIGFVGTAGNFFIGAFDFGSTGVPATADTWHDIEHTTNIYEGLVLQSIQIQLFTDGTVATNDIVAYVDDVYIEQEGLRYRYDHEAAQFDGAMLRWRMDDTHVLSNATDATGNERHGTIGAGVTRAQAGLLAESSSFSFSGASTSSQVTLASSTWLNGLEALSVCVWVKANTVGHSRGILFAKAPDDTSTAMKIAYDTSGDVGGAVNCIAVWVYTPDGLVEAYTLPNTQSNKTQFIVATWQSGVGITVYINGVQQTLSGSANSNLVSTTTGAGTLTLGRSNATATSGVWDGYIDDLSIYSSVLSDDDVERLYNLGLRQGRFGDSNYCEWPQGVFLLSSPKRAADAAGVVTREVKAYDQLQILLDDKVSTRFSVASGTVYTTQIQSILTGAGIPLTSLNITASTKTLPVAKEWEPGISKLQIVNDLLAAINYVGIYFDENGAGIVRSYISPTNLPSEIDYANDSASVMLPGVAQDLDLFAVPNKWTIVVSEPDQPMLVATYTNSDPASPTSTVNRARTIVDFRTEIEAADQATLNEKVERLAFEASQIYEHVEFGTGLMPIHAHADVYRIEFTKLAISNKYTESEWSFPFAAGAEMRHVARRIVEV
jgi:hypothetical protein